MRVVELVIAIIFILEYIIRIATAEQKLKFIFSFYGIVDFLAILPFLFGLLNLQFLRVFRLLRLLRIFKLTRYSKSLSNFILVIRGIKEELIIFSLISIFIIYLASVGIYFFEQEAQPEAFSSIIHSMWWAVATLTTVGYGDIYPITIGGKIFTFVILLIGLGIVSVPTAIIASALTKQKDK